MTRHLCYFQMLWSLQRFSGFQWSYPVILSTCVLCLKMKLYLPQCWFSAPKSRWWKVLENCLFLFLITGVQDSGLRKFLPALCLLRNGWYIYFTNYLKYKKSWSESYCITETRTSVEDSISHALLAVPLSALGMPTSLVVEPERRPLEQTDQRFSNSIEKSQRECSFFGHSVL